MDVKPAMYFLNQFLNKTREFPDSTASGWAPYGVRYEPGLDALTSGKVLRSRHVSLDRLAPILNFYNLRDLLTLLRNPAVPVDLVCTENGRVERVERVKHLKCNLKGHSLSGNLCIHPVPLGTLKDFPKWDIRPRETDVYTAWCSRQCTGCKSGQHMVKNNVLTLWDNEGGTERKVPLKSILMVNGLFFGL
jgi:hypothetical protein